MVDNSVTKKGRQTPSLNPRKLRVESPIRFATRWLKELSIYVGAVGALLFAVEKLQKRFIELYPKCPVWLLIAAASTPLLTVLFTHTIPMIILRIREKRLKEWGAQNNIVRSGYFRLAPYEESNSDRDRFLRADGFHDVVLNWIISTRDRVLFLTGTSGAGKSSLLNASVLPRLRERQDGLVPLILRPGLGDPEMTLRIKALNPGAIWKTPPDDLGAVDLTQILHRACAHLRPRELLVVFDQFEEILLLDERDSKNTESFRLLLCTLKALDHVKVLFVLRSDYIGMAQTNNWASLLPPMRDGTNWKEVSAFRERDARVFLTASGLNVGPKLLDTLFDQIAEIEGSVGLVRPITVNMVGLALDSFATRPAKLHRLSTSHGGLLHNFIKTQISQPEIAAHVPPLLGSMVDISGSRRTRTIDELCEQTGFPKQVITGCLFQLLRRGLVRLVNEREEIWEISHDFVARIIEFVLSSRKASVARQVRRFAFPSAIILWVLLFAALPIFTERLRKIPVSSLTARMEFGSDPGDPCPPAIGSSTLELAASPRYESGRSMDVYWRNALGDNTELELLGTGVANPMEQHGEEGEESCWQTINYSQFEGKLGNFERPREWKNAWMEARIDASANDVDWDDFIKNYRYEDDNQAEREMVKYYNISAERGMVSFQGTNTGVEGELTVLENGAEVWSQRGLIVITGGGYHNEPWQYTIKFLPAQTKLLRP